MTYSIIVLKRLLQINFTTKELILHNPIHNSKQIEPKGGLSYQHTKQDPISYKQTCKSKIEMQITKKKKNNNPKALTFQMLIKLITAVLKYCLDELVLSIHEIIQILNYVDSLIIHYYHFNTICWQHNMYTYLSYIYLHII